MREENAVADGEITLARIHDHGWPPTLAAIVADLHMRLFRRCVFGTFVESVGCVELIFVPSKANTERKFGTVSVRSFILDDVKLGIRHLLQF